MVTDGPARRGWRKSSRSAGQGECVEVNLDAPTVSVRDSHDRFGPVLTFTRASWIAFVEGIKHDGLTAGEGENGRL